MTEVLAVVLVWQVLLLGGWAMMRRLRRLERAVRPPYAQVGALRAQIVALRTDLDESSVRVEAELRTLLRRQEKLSRLVLERIGRVEAQLVARVGEERSGRLASSGS
ncbi:MAG TPA: hypothetical protein VGJ86_22155 [Acidimicrobiales bacterium]|jgi:hypothetical protein